MDARQWERLSAAVVLAAALAACGGGDGSGDATPGGNPGAGATAWLDAHNAVRAGSFAGVTLSPAPSPPLRALAWSAQAESVAQAWANGCDYRHNPNRGTGGMARGENIAATAPAGRADATPGYIIGQWGSEWSDYHHGSNHCADGRVCGHYTQMVWRDTTHVGCARARCTVNSPFGAQSPTWDYFVCNYEPPGNMAGQRPY